MIGAHLSTLRRGLKLTHKQVAARTGFRVAAGDLLMYENGTADPTGRELADLARVYGTDVVALFTEAGAFTEADVARHVRQRAKDAA